MIGLTLNDRAMTQFMKDAKPVNFEFIVQDIYSIEPTVKCMHVVDFGTGIMLQELAEEGNSTGNLSQRFLHRIESMADDSFLRALKAMPSHTETADKVKLINEIRSRDKLAFRK